MSKKRVLVVEDSALMREMIGDFVRETSDLELAGTASDGRKALEVFSSLKPDVVTLDIEMPVMNGLQTLDALLQLAPVPVIMVSSQTQLGASVTFQALDRGALDYVSKPEHGAQLASGFKDDLLRKIRQVAGSDVQRILSIRRQRAERAPQRITPAPTAAPTTSTTQADPGWCVGKCIALGISTGGPPALSNLFEMLQPPLPPIVVVQHMPVNFTKPFAWRLNSLSALSIKEAESGDVLQPNHVYIAPGGMHLSLVKSGNMVRCRVRDGENVSGHKPSVDVMMQSAAEIFGRNCLGVIMTGMGRDGADGCKWIRRAGGYVLGQNEASSDVYGMNKVAFVEGNVDKQFALPSAAQTLSMHARRIGSASMLVGS